MSATSSKQALEQYYSNVSKNSKNDNHQNNINNNG
jgi:hypothetical protein